MTKYWGMEHGLAHGNNVKAKVTNPGFHPPPTVFGSKGKNNKKTTNNKCEGCVFVWTLYLREKKDEIEKKQL